MDIVKCYTGGSEDEKKATSREMQAASRNLERHGDGFFPRASRRNVDFQYLDIRTSDLQEDNKFGLLSTKFVVTSVCLSH